MGKFTQYVPNTMTESKIAEQLRDIRQSMPGNFSDLVGTDELSRMPTDAEMDAAMRLVERRVRDGMWQDTVQEQAVLLCAVADITTTLELP